MLSRRIRLFLLACLCCVPLTSQGKCSVGLCSNTQYDTYLREGAYRYMNQWVEGDWTWWKAQCYQESLLNPMAVSRAGAQGLCQVMPKTWLEQTSLMGISASPFNPRASSLVGAAYMQRMFRGWKSYRAPADHRRWAWGSYNYGVGNMLRGQRAAGMSTSWEDVVPLLPREVQTYVERIERWHTNLNEERSAQE